MNQQAIPLRWLEDSTAAGELGTGVTWGIPWSKGALKREEPLSLLGPQGQSLPMQSWPTAFWPDGSVKWTAHAASIPAGQKSDAFAVERCKPADPRQAVIVRETGAQVEVDTGRIVCRFNRQGPSLISAIYRGDKQVCSGGRLVGIREARSLVSGCLTRREEPFQSVVEQVDVEQTGPVRAVVKVTGRHRGSSGGRSWLPFTLRFYLYAGQDSVKLMHTFLFDGNPHEDFIQGLGIRFTVPMSGPLYNRHVRLAGDTGFFSESPLGLMTLRTAGKYETAYREQFAGGPIAFNAEEDAKFLGLLDNSAVWDSFKLTQLTPDSYSIRKRTKPECCWIQVAAGGRAGGWMYVGGTEGGGLAVGMRHFWQKSPASLEAQGLAGDEATLTAWFWSPDGEAMDLRHYDTETHLHAAYEGFEELRATPYGVGNTNELTIWCCDSTPEHAVAAEMERAKEHPALLVCEPEHYCASKAAGVWSPEDRSTPMKRWLETALDSVFRFYADEVEQRRWYGFWNYGDVMHSYDPVRHTWRYDIGGCAWQNTELVPNLWLWYMFLRSGRADAFRMAEAMARHTSEVDVYHIGEYAGLGSRHNVVHWGCGCKEARIGMAGLHAMFYYLTGDERIGDIMNESIHADYATERLDPMRAYCPKDEFPTHARSGPDWTAFASNWLARWERYEDPFFRDKLMVGIDSLKQQPFGLMTGPIFGYDPRSGRLHWMGDENWGHHLMICMGGSQVWMELAQVLQDPVWETMVVEYGAFYTLPKEEKIRLTSGKIQGVDWNIPMLATPLMAYSAAKSGDAVLAEQAWQLLLEEKTHWQLQLPLQTSPVEPLHSIRPMREIPWMTTNTASQWSINVMQCLALIGDHLPELKEETTFHD